MVLSEMQLTLKGVSDFGSVRFFVFGQLELIINLPIFPVSQGRDNDMHR